MVSCSVVQGVQTGFTSEVKSQGTRTFHVDTHLVSSANTFQSKVFSLEGLHILDSIPLCFGLFLDKCLHVSSPVPSQRHRCARTIRPRKTNLSTSDGLYTSVTSGPAPVLIRRRDFRRRKPSVCGRARERFEKDENSNPGGQNKSCGNMIVFSALHKTVCKHNVLWRT